MADTSSCPGMTVCRLRVVIAGISPLIWRLEVAAGTTIAGLHAIMQTVFSWSGEHLHRFVIGGADQVLGGELRGGQADDIAVESLAVAADRPQRQVVIPAALIRGVRVDAGDVAWTWSRRPGLASIRPTWTLTVPLHRWQFGGDLAVGKPDGELAEVTR